MPTIQFSYFDSQEDDYLTDEEFDACWVICDYCEGEGDHCRHLGAITEADRYDWGPDEEDAYFSGAYNKTCEVCKGSGKVLEINMGSIIDPTLKKDVEKQLKENERENRQRAREIAMGY